MVLQCLLRWSRRQRSVGRLAGQLLILCTFLLLLHDLLHRPPSASSQYPVPAQSSRPLSPLLAHQAKFWREFYTLILNNDPSCQYPPEFVVPHKLDVGFDADHNHPRPDILWMRPADLQRMRVAHSTFLSDLRKDAPALVYEPASKGIVLTAGLKQLPVLVIGLRMLRRTDCDLAVEVFLSSSDDYDQQVCDLVLPALNARCIVFSDIVAASKTGVALEGYQFKIMSLLFSSFDDVLLLDSDAFPTKNPTPLFDNEPFNLTGMLLWPDFWYPSESPYYFELAQLGAPPPLNARPAIESGEMMFSKSKHNLTLLLAAYYNYYGPQYFYPLLAQGAPGQGDKDTFPWAATVLHSNSSFYLVREPVFALGHVDSNEVFVGSAMAQHNPVEDIQHFHTRSPGLDGPYHHTEPDFGHPNAHPQSNTSLPTTEPLQSTPLFVHANFPKFDPSTIFYYGTQGTPRPVFDSNGTAVRAWLPEQHSIAYFGYDLERAFWAEVQYVACNWYTMFTAWEGQEGICENVKMYRQRVFS